MKKRAAKLRLSNQILSAAILAALLFLPSFFSQTAKAAAAPLSGSAWSDNFGWFLFSGTDTAGKAYGVSVDNATGKFSGSAWSDNAGWIDFSAGQTTLDLSTGATSGQVSGTATLISNGSTVTMRGTAGDGTAYGVNYNFTTKKFSGSAWNDTVGWITFAGTDTSGNPYAVTGDIVQAPSVPGAPTAEVSCTGAPPAAISITVRWSAVTGADGYKLYRSVNGAAFAFYKDAGSVVSYSDTGVIDGSTYAYKVSSYNQGGESAQSPASPTRTATCAATVKVTSTLALSGLSWNLTEAGPQNNAVANTTYPYTVHPATAGTAFTLGSIKNLANYDYTVAYKLNAGSSTSCSTNGLCTVTIFPADTLDYTITYTAILAPPSVSASVPRCQRVDVNVTDNSIGESEFLVYRDTDNNYANGTTPNQPIATIPSYSSGTTGTVYQYTDILTEADMGASPTKDFYYHGIARRASDGVVSPTPGTSNKATVSVCPPKLDASNISIVQVTRAGLSFGYTPTTKIRNGDLLEVHINIINTENTQATNITTSTDLTPNFQLATDLGPSVVQVDDVNTAYTYANNNLKIPATGDLGSLGNGTKKVKFMARIASTKTNAAFDRFNAGGIINYNFQGSPQKPVPYDLGYVLIYMQPTNQPVQFKEGSK